MFYPSAEQKDICNYILDKKNKGETIQIDIIAPAGSGKSTTELYLMDALGDTNQVYLVFNPSMVKELKQRLNFATSPFQNIDKEKLKLFTFHGYIRKILTEQTNDIGFDFKNGSIAQEHMRKIFQANATDASNSDLNTVVDSFNAYIKEFLKTTQSLEDFIGNEGNKPNVNPFIIDALSQIFKNVKQMDTEGVKNLPLDEQEDILKDIYDNFLDTVFNKDALNAEMPHDIYYKYVFYKYEDLDLFKDYDYVHIDEAQDIDPIFIALLEKSKGINLIKCGDNFQQINRFRGTVNSIENADNKRFNLTMSYRLTPYLGLLTEAFLSKEAKQLEYDAKIIPNIYGGSKTQRNLKELGVQTVDTAKFFRTIVNDLSKVKVEESDIYLDIKEQQDEIKDSINKGKVAVFNKAVSSFSKTKDYTTLYNSILDNTSLFNEHDETVQSTNMELIQNDRNSQISKELFQIAKNYTFKLNNKEKKELLSTSSGSFGFLARNNKKVIDAVYNLVQSIPNEKLSDIPLFNIKFSSALSSTFDDFTKNKMESLSPKNISMMSRGLSNITSKLDSNLDVWEHYKKLKSIDMSKGIPKQILSKLISNPDLCFKFVDIKMISDKDFTISKVNDGNTKHALSYYGVSGQDLKGIIDNAIKTVKTKFTKDKIEKDTFNVDDVLNNTQLNSISKLIPFDKFVASQTSIEELEQLELKFIENYFKYSQTQEIAKYNPNINLVKDGAFYNIYCSTVHQVKGLEMDNVLLANDIYCLDDDKDLEENRDEFKLAYVALTRTKETLSVEEGSALTNVFDEIIDSNYSRYYQSENILVVEHLSCNASKLPSMEIYAKNNIDFTIDKKEMQFFESSTYPNYKDLSAIVNNLSGELIDIVIKGDEYQDKLNDNTKIQYFKPLDIGEDDFNEIIKDWQIELASSHEELLSEAQNMF